MDERPVGAAVRGFNLLELLAVMLVLAVALSLAAPSLRDLVRDNRLEVESRRLLDTLALARSEAIRSNAVVSVCPSPMARTGDAACEGSYAQGWIVFLNADADRAVHPVRDTVLRVYAGLPSGYHITNRAGTRLANALINYRPDGRSSQNVTLHICPPENAAGASRSIVLSMAGRARLDRYRGLCRVLV